MSHYDFPCICCQNGDSWSNVICDKCEQSIEHRKEVFESMVSLVHDINDIVGHTPHSLSDKIKESVQPIYDQLVAIKIEDTRIKK